MPVVMVDEAHCIVKQGSGFREDYLRIKDFVAGLPERPVVAAFTATATPETADEIAVKLALRAPYIHRIERCPRQYFASRDRGRL